MLEIKTESIIDLIFDKQFKTWLTKGKPKGSEFSNLTASTIAEAIELVTVLEGEQTCFSKEQINHKYTDLRSRLNFQE